MAEELMRAYRPKTFEEFVGSKGVIQSVTTNMGVVHKYLFYGPRGCGKTTLARLVAGALGIANEFDLMEIDAADKRKIADARNLKSTVYTLPMEGEGHNKIYIIDEVHRLTPEAFDSLLKTIEEPPDFVYFVLCTTDINAVPSTIRSRCKGGEFYLGALSDRSMDQLLDWVTKEEKIEITDDVYYAIIKGAQGIPRDALGLLEQVKGLDDEDAVELAQQGTLDDASVKQLIKLLMSKNPSWNEAREILKGVPDDVEKIRHSVKGYLTAVMLNSEDPYYIACVLDELLEPFYNSGKAGLSMAVYRAIALEETPDSPSSGGPTEDDIPF